MNRPSVAFYDTKPYDREWFDRIPAPFDIHYFESKLTPDTAPLAEGCSAVCAFVNDDISAAAVDALASHGVGAIAMRCAGYSNVDFRAAYGKLHILRVPAYSPHAVAEHAMALLLSLNRKIPRAANRTRDFNYSLVGLCGMVLNGKTAGVIGTGRIGRCFIDICRGFGMRVVAYDPYPAEGGGIEYLPLDELLSQADVISLHCPLTEGTRHIISRDALSKVKPGGFIINTSRGELIDTEALIEALDAGVVGGAGLDVYEEEADLFFEDFSGQILLDDTLALLTSKPNVLITAHQAFLTEEALEAIARVTVENLRAYFNGEPLQNEVCYHCGGGECRKKQNGRCF